MCLYTVYEDCQFTKYENMSSTGADRVANVNTLDVCLSACKDDTANCKAVEYSDEFGCYMHSDAGYLDNAMDNEGVTIYNLNECGEWRIWVVWWRGGKASYDDSNVHLWYK